MRCYVPATVGGDGAGQGAPVLITAKRLFDGRGDRVLADQVIEIARGRIAGIGPRGPTVAGRELTDLGDATLLPGLIDIHQHLAFDASSDPVARLEADDDAALLVRMRRAARRALAAGITTIRDLGDRNYLSLVLRDSFGHGETGPRLLVSGPPVTVTGGHCWFLGGEADGEDGVRRAVRDRAARGVDIIKIMATGGNMTPTLGPHESQYTLAELTAATDEAHAHSLPVAAHAHGAGGIADALRAGVDSIEHVTFFTADDVDADPGVLRELAGRQVILSMTAAVVPGVTAPYPAILKRLEAIFANHAALYRAGARIVCSSDAGVGPNKPHDALPYGVSGFLPVIGMTNAEALRNVTATAAAACGIAGITGTLEVGKDADIIAVAGNPLDDLSALHNVVAVFARGVRA
jgi:imidazolonepropionase-like amidohydrolase